MCSAIEIRVHCPQWHQKSSHQAGRQAGGRAGRRNPTSRRENQTKMVKVQNSTADSFNTYASNRTERVNDQACNVNIYLVPLAHAVQNQNRNSKREKWIIKLQKWTHIKQQRNYVPPHDALRTGTQKEEVLSQMRDVRRMGPHWHTHTLAANYMHFKTHSPQPSSSRRLAAPKGI